MDNLENLNNNGQVPKIVVKDTKTNPVSGAVCVGSNEQIRLAFIEDKLSNDEFGNVEIVQECNLQIIMTPQVARNIIQVIEDNLASNSY